MSACERPTPPEGDARGPALYETCAQCHGADGGGMPEFTAPAIAGLPEWYIRAQLEKFQSGARGAHAQDSNGLRMRGMARTLNRPGDVDAVAAYVAGMPVVAPDDVVAGNVEHGRELFATCIQCHGEQGLGDETRHAPPLTNLDGWYIVSSLGLFKEGIRGTNPRDEWGITMRPMSLGLADEQAMADVAAYIRTLRGG
jgi:cytochrome c553